MQRRRRVEHHVAGAELVGPLAAAPVDDELAAVVALRIGEEHRHRYVGTAPVEQRVVDVLAVAHAGLVAAEAERLQALGQHGQLEQRVVEHRVRHELGQLDVDLLALVELQVLLDELGVITGGRATVDERRGRKRRLHLGENVRRQHRRYAEDHGPSPG